MAPCTSLGRFSFSFIHNRVSNLFQHKLQTVNSNLCNIFSRNLSSRQEIVKPEEERIKYDSQSSAALIAKIHNQIAWNQQGRLFAIVYLCGQQYKITTEDLIVVQQEFIPELGENLKLTKIILIGGKDFTLIGRPLLNPKVVKINVSIIEKTLSHIITDFYYRKRSRYRRMRIMRYPYTMLRINNISIEGDINSNSENENLVSLN